MKKENPENPDLQIRGGGGGVFWSKISEGRPPGPLPRSATVVDTSLGVVLREMLVCLVG